MYICAHGNVDTPDPGLYFLLPAAGRRPSRLPSVLFLHKEINQDLKIYQSCCSRWSKQGVDLMLGGGSAPTEDRISIPGPNNNLAYLGKQYVFSCAFFPSAGAHFPLHTRGGTSIILRQSAGTQTDAHSAEEKVERWSRCSLNNRVQRKPTG